MELNLNRMEVWSSKILQETSVDWQEAFGIQSSTDLTLELIPLISSPNMRAAQVRTLEESLSFALPYATETRLTKLSRSVFNPFKRLNSGVFPRVGLIT